MPQLPTVTTSTCTSVSITLVTSTSCPPPPESKASDTGSTPSGCKSPKHPAKTWCSTSVSVTKATKRNSSSSGGGGGNSDSSTPKRATPSPSSPSKSSRFFKGRGAKVKTTSATGSRVSVTESPVQEVAVNLSKVSSSSSRKSPPSANLSPPSASPVPRPSSAPAQLKPLLPPPLIPACSADEVSKLRALLNPVMPLVSASISDQLLRFPSSWMNLPRSPIPPGAAPFLGNRPHSSPSN